MADAKYRRAGWRAAASSRWIRLDSQLREAEAVASAPTQPTCDEARRLLVDASEGFATRSLGSWLTGSAEEQIATTLDCAEELIFQTGTDAQRIRYGKVLRDRISQRFSAKDHRRAEALDPLGPAKDAPTAEGLRAAAQILSRGSLDLRSIQRARRNATLAATGMVLVATVALVFGVDHWRFLSFARFGHRPHSGAVAVLGAFGGLLSVAALLLRSDRVTRASGGFLVQAAFKVALGAFLAPVALLLTQRSILGITTPQGVRALTVWAIVVGYSQDIVTRKLDDRLNASQPPPTTGDPTSGTTGG